MRNVIKRVMGLVLCAALILGDNATLGFAQELSDISVETLLEDEAFEAEENLTDVSFNDAFDISFNDMEDVSAGDETEALPETEDAEPVIEEVVPEEAAGETVSKEETLVAETDVSAGEEEVITVETEDVSAGEEVADVSEGEEADFEEETADEGEILYYEPYARANYKLGYTVANKKVTIVSTVTEPGVVPHGELVIPGKIGKYPVTVIGANAFAGCDELVGTLTIPDSVKEIGENSFYNCGFTEIKIGKAVKTIGAYAFDSCGYLRGTLTIPSSVTSFGDYALNDCVGLQKIVNSSKVSDIRLPELTYPLCWINASTSAGNVSVVGAGQTVVRNDYETICTSVHFDTCFPYTGSPIEFGDFDVYYEATLLEKGIDYTVSYKNNVNVYYYGPDDIEFNKFNKKKAPSVTITLKGNYSGKKTFYFRISQYDLDNSDISYDTVDPIIATGKNITPSLSLYHDDKKLKLGKDYRIYTYSSIDDPNVALNTIKEPGSYYVWLEGRGNYRGYIYIPFSVVSSDNKYISKATVKISDITYTKEAVTFDASNPVVKYNGKRLTYLLDYVIGKPDDDDWTKVGTHTAIIYGMNGYVGTKKVTFKIKGYDISKVKIIGSLAPCTYDGIPNYIQVSSILLKYQDKSYSKTLSIVSLESYEGFSDEWKGYYDAYYYYENNTNAGTATVKFVGVNNFTGTIKKTFKINAYDMAADAAGKISITGISSSFPFFKGGVKPTPTVKFGETTLVAGKDYTVSYANNTKYNGSKTPTVKIKGKGNFKGTVTRTFTIKEMGLATARAMGALVVSAPDTAYSTKKGGFKSKISLTFDGIKLKAGTDYEKKIEYKYHLTGEPIADNEKNIPAGTEIDFTITAKPGSGFKGTISGTYRITKYDINKLTVKVKDKGYVSGGVYLDTSDISFKGYYNDDVTFVIDETSYKNNFKKGKATVVIKGTGDYGGTKTITYKIVVRKALSWQLPALM